VHALGCTLQQYADAKRLPVEHLRSLGISQFSYLRSPALRVPYVGRNGEELAVRLRIAVAGADKFRWAKGAKPHLYGLNRLPEARDAGYRLIVEGESDCHTAWFHGLPAVGIPGAPNWNDARDAPHLDDGLPLYLVVEPDRGGETLINKLGASRLRDSVRLLRVDGFKDLSALHLADPDRFLERLHAARVVAVPLRDEIAAANARERLELAQTAGPLARLPDILAAFAEDVQRAGLVGEDRAAKLLFLVLVSRLTERPVSVVVKGPSSGGKSFTVEIVLRFFPPDAYYALSAMSERALAYSMEPLSHRHLVLYEAAGMSGDFASYLIRSLLSEGRLRYETLEKTSEGIMPRLLEREGPTGLIVTTTAVSLHPENETRLLSIPVTDTPAQTALILGRMASNRREVVDFERWHALQGLLASGDTTVSIPFAEELAAAIPPVAVRLRRDFGALLNLIRAHAILHNATRARDEDGAIVATLADYEAVRALVEDLISDGIGASVSATTRETANAVAALAVEAETSIAAVAAHLGLDRTSAGRRVRVAIDKGYVRNLEDRRGGKLRLRPGEPLPDDVRILPDLGGVQLCSTNGGGIPSPLPPEWCPAAGCLQMVRADRPCPTHGAQL
jgi:hypothetical protein